MTIKTKLSTYQIIGCQETENAKVSIRNARRDANDELKKLDGVSEDILKDSEAEVQNLTNSFTLKIDELFTKKEEEILKV